MAPPVTYLAGGLQYVSLMVGWGGTRGLRNPAGEGPMKPGFDRIVTFAIGGSTRLNPPVWGHKDSPVPALPLTASAAEVKEGAILYCAHCAPCHGDNVIAGIVPDLRYSTAETHRQFEAIVLGGARETLGMSSFKGVLTSEQVRAIQAYVLSRSAESAKAVKAANARTPPQE